MSHARVMVQVAAGRHPGAGRVARFPGRFRTRRAMFVGVNEREMTGTTVLVVDDDVAVRTRIRSVLVAAGHAVLEAGNGREALALLTSEEQPQPSAIVLDLAMPLMSGWELLAIIKSYHRLALIPVLVISGGHPHADALAHGAIDGCLFKPFGGPELLARLDEILRARA